MAGKTIVLRVRTRKGIFKVQNLTSNNTIEELKKTIAELTGIAYSNLRLLRGYPPKQVEGDNTSLQSNSIKDGELFTIDESTVSASMPAVEATNVEKASSAAQPAPSQTPLPKQQQQITTSTSQPTGDGKDESLDEGVLLRKVVPANNSCLFTSVYFVMENGLYDLDCQKSMRDLIAKTVKGDPLTFNEAILGKKNSDYCQWIRDSNSWGGSIEIMILSKYYKCEICVVDIRTGRIDRFGEDCAYPNRVFIIYDGIHFDPLFLELKSSKIKTKFSTKSDAVMAQAMKMAHEAKNAKLYTDVHNFKLKCLVCQQGLVGQNDAQEHAKKTGHINFSEY